MPLSPNLNEINILAHGQEKIWRDIPCFQALPPPWRLI